MYGSLDPSLLYGSVFKTQPRPIKRKIKNSFFPRIKIKREQDPLPKELVLRFLQENSLVDNSKGIQFDPDLIIRQQNILNQLCLDGPDQINFIDSKDIKPVNKRAVECFYQHYKRLSKIKDQNNLSGVKSLLDRSVKLKALPCRIGMVREGGSQTQIRISNYKIGDSYAQILSEGLKQNSRLSQYMMSNNRISDRGASEILKKISGRIKILDFSNNLIENLEGHFINSLFIKDCTLQKLNLENNKLNSKSIKELLNAVSSNRSMTYLNLSQNQISNEHAYSLTELLEENQVLQQLYLRWNDFNGLTATAIFQSLMKNNNLKVLDLSFNNIGGGGPSSCVGALCQTIKKNRILMHIDLSQNCFLLQECDQIAEALKKNNTLIGFHFSGNFGYVDSKGFLIIAGQDRIIRSVYDQSYQFKIDSTNIKKHYKRSKFDSEPEKNSCWICEGWAQCRFQIPKDPSAWIHLAHQGYTGRYLNSDSSKSHYLTMIPPGKIPYFYSDSKSTFINQQQQSNIFPQENLNLSFGEDRKVSLNVSQKNVVDILAIRNIINFKPTFSVRPRFQQNFPAKIKVEAQRWKFQVSIWYREWKNADDDTNKKCFEKDWNMSKIPKLIKNPQQQEKVKKFMQEHYNNIRNLYKYFSAISPVGDVWSITNNAFSQFCNSMKLVDAKLPLKIIDLVFITTNSATAIDWRGNSRNPERGIIRFQFLQALVRLADQKYVKTESIPIFQAISTLINQNLVSQYKSYSIQAWRAKFFCEQNDLLIKKFRPVFQNVYKKNSKLKVKPGEKPFMSVDQFKFICLKCDLTSGRFDCTQKNASVCYNLAMMIQVDQLQSDRIFRMQFIQFIEAFTRVCDEASPGRLGDAELSPKSVRQGYPIHQKLQWGISQMLKSCCSQDIRIQFQPLLNKQSS